MHEITQAGKHLIQFIRNFLTWLSIVLLVHLAVGDPLVATGTTASADLVWLFWPWWTLCCQAEGWTRWPTEVPSNPYHSVILWFCEATLFHHCLSQLRHISHPRGCSVGCKLMLYWIWCKLLLWAATIPLLLLQLCGFDTPAMVQPHGKSE